jgi:hypothetical protein
LKAPFSNLEHVVGSGKGETYYWGTNNYFGMLLPLRDRPLREDFPKLETQDWDELYQLELVRTSWDQLRNKAFRFCNLTTQFVSALKTKGEATVLVP